MINNPANEKVKYARSLLQRRHRQKEGRCLIEGVQLVEEAVRAGVIPALAFHVPALRENQRAAALLAHLRALAVPVHEVSPSVLATLSDTVTPQGLVAVVPIPHLPAPVSATWVLVVDGLRDPGNLGTVLRTAWAAGVERVLLTPGSVDPYNPKVLRGAMGAHFHLPVEWADWAATAAAVRGMAVWLADVEGDVEYETVDWRQPSALIVGSEASGASAEARRLATGRVCISMAGGAESLNVAVATGVLLFEARRQRRAAMGH